MGTPLLPADFRSETMGFPQNSGNSGRIVEKYKEKLIRFAHNWNSAMLE